MFTLTPIGEFVRNLYDNGALGHYAANGAEADYFDDTTSHSALTGDILPHFGRRRVARLRIHFRGD